MNRAVPSHPVHCHPGLCSFQLGEPLKAAWPVVGTPASSCGATRGQRRTLAAFAAGGTVGEPQPGGPFLRIGRHAWQGGNTSSLKPLPRMP